MKKDKLIYNFDFFQISGEKFFYKSLSFDLLYRAYGEAVSNTFMLMSTWLTVTMAFSRWVEGESVDVGMKWVRVGVGGEVCGCEGGLRVEGVGVSVCGCEDVEKLYLSLSC